MACVAKPRVGLCLRDDGEDLDRAVRDVIEHPNVIDAEPVLRAAHPPESLHAALTGPCRLVPEKSVKRVADRGAAVGREGPKLADGARQRYRTPAALSLWSLTATPART